MVRIYVCKNIYSLNLTWEALRSHLFWESRIYFDKIDTRTISRIYFFAKYILALKFITFGVSVRICPYLFSEANATTNQYKELGPPYLFISIYEECVSIRIDPDLFVSIRIYVGTSIYVYRYSYVFVCIFWGCGSIRFYSYLFCKTSILVCICIYFASLDTWKI